MGELRLALVMALLSTLAACSPYSYSKEISKISDGVNALSSAYDTGFDGLAADRNAKAQLEILDARGSGGKIARSPSCLDSCPCHLSRPGILMMEPAEERDGHD
jgi:hypothetical protein